MPRKVHEPRLHNPFPQLSRVAVLPFFNQSGEPTLNGSAVANAYRNELQKIQGFEVMPIGVAEQLLLANRFEINEASDFQKLAQLLNVDVVVVGAVTDFYEYYPPRMGMAVNWYAANSCFQPIPPGYGLPWCTAEEEFIPDTLRREAEFAMARQQLNSATPKPGEKVMDDLQSSDGMTHERAISDWQDAGAEDETSQQRNSSSTSGLQSITDAQIPHDRHEPNTPSSQRSTKCAEHHGPIIELVRQYNGHDAKFTRRLATYYDLRADARFGGWQSYLQRKDDFIGFCCYLHIAETLAARGGADQTRVVWHRPNDR